jgi:hypothetical protein
VALQSLNRKFQFFCALKARANKSLTTILGGTKKASYFRLSWSFSCQFTDDTNTIPWKIFYSFTKIGCVYLDDLISIHNDSRVLGWNNFSWVNISKQEERVLLNCQRINQKSKSQNEQLSSS